MSLVTAVVCIGFDEATDEQLLAVRDKVRAGGVDLPASPPHRPHISLVAARVEREGELDRLLDVAADVAARHVRFEMTLGEVGRFDRAGALWLGPAASDALDALHRDCVTAVVDAGWPSAFGDRSAPGSWVPHCTLATRLPAPTLHRLQQQIATGYQPVHACVDAVVTILVGGRGDAGHAPLHSI